MVFEKPVMRLESEKALLQAIISSKCSPDEYDLQDLQESLLLQVQSMFSLFVQVGNDSDMSLRILRSSVVFFGISCWKKEEKQDK